jgi:DNA-binding GntR family transcriptional regulator
MSRRGANQGAAAVVEEDAKADVRRRTSANAVADGLARLIEMRVYQPGDRLREQEIAERFNVSRGPVREALRMLEAKSLVRIESMRGATVARLSDAEARDAVEISAVLFGLACELAAQRVTPADIQVLLERHRMLAAMVGEDVPAKEFFQQTLRMGHRVLSASGSKRLMSLVVDVRVGAPDVYGPLGYHNRRLRDASVAKWAGLIDALERGEAARASQIGRQIHDDVLDAALKVLG